MEYVELLRELLSGVAAVVLLQAVIGYAMHFTAYQVGVDGRKFHRDDLIKGSKMAVVLTLWSFLIGAIMLRSIPDSWVSAYPILQEIVKFGFAISAALSATDPVAVSALMLALSNHHSTKKLGVVLEVESLFNDPLALLLFQLALSRGQEAIYGLIWAIAASAVIIVVSTLTIWLAKWLHKNPEMGFVNARYFSTPVRIVLTLAAIYFGMHNEAATITLGVVSGFVMGVIEAPYHHESHKRIDQVLFWLGTFVLILSIILAAKEVYLASIETPSAFLFGCLFMSLLRLVTRLSGTRLFHSKAYVELAIGGSGAIGVLAIAVSEMHHAGHLSVSGFMAGCAAISIAVFIYPTFKLFLNYARNHAQSSDEPEPVFQEI